MILDEEILVSLYGINIKHYEKLGYFIPRGPAKDSHKHRYVVPKGTKIIVKVADLPDGSNEIVRCKCDYCNKEFDRMYCLITRSRKDGNLNDSCGTDECERKRSIETRILKYGSSNQKDICEANGSLCGRGVKYSFDDVKLFFESKGLIIQEDLLEDKNHITVDVEIPYVCNYHKEYGIQYSTISDTLKRKNCCIYGSYEERGNINQPEYVSEAQNICTIRNYTLLTDFITSVDSKIEYICNTHPEYGVQTTTLYGMRKYDNNCKLCASAKFSGENHWNWHGGVNGVNESERKSWEYKKWRQDVWKRDNFTCQCCGKTINDIVLNAHHIRNFSDCEELRYDVDNGITLCEECHSMFSPNGFHHIYGVKNNTREQLEEYIEQRKQHL